MSKKIRALLGLALIAGSTLAAVPAGAASVKRDSSSTFDHINAQEKDPTGVYAGLPDWARAQFGPN